MTTSTHLAAFGVTMNEARAFIEANILNPTLIHDVAREYALNNAMLGEIAGGFSASEVRAYFAYFGIDSNDLEPTPTALQLADYGVTMNQAREYLFAHVDNPQHIYQFAQQYQLSNAMLGEITGYSEADVAAFFRAAGIPDDDEPIVLPFLPEELAGIAAEIAPLLVAENTSTGALSNDVLRSSIVSSLGISEEAYLEALNPYNLLELDPTGTIDDSLFDPAVLDQLGLGAFASLPPTGETIESLLFGTVINVVNHIDEGEIAMLNLFMQQNSALIEEMDTETLAELGSMLELSLSTPAETPLVPEEDLAEALVLVGTMLVGIATTGELPDLFGDQLFA